jgi:hypothetical protein
MARVSQAQFASFIRVLRNEFWGLCSHPVCIGTFANTCWLMVEHKPLGTGLRYYHLMVDDFVHRLRVHDGVASIGLFEHAPWSEPLGFAESSFIYFASSVGLVTRKLSLAQVRLRNVKSAYNAETRWLFEADVLYNQLRAGLSFNAKWLKLPVIQNRRTLITFLAEASASLSVKYRGQLAPPTAPVHSTARSKAGPVWHRASTACAG